MGTHNLEIRENGIQTLFNSLQTGNTDAQVIASNDIALKTIDFASNQPYFFQVNQLEFDEEYPCREAFANVIGTLNDPGFNFVYVLTGSKSQIKEKGAPVPCGVTLHIGVVRNNNDSKTKLSAVNYGEMIARAFQGNFNGSNSVRLRNGQLDAFLKKKESFKSAGVIMGVPAISKNEKDGRQQDFQGIDRLINSMLGTNWRLVVVCEPVSQEEINIEYSKALNLYNKLSFYSKVTCQTGTNQGATISFGTQTTRGEGKVFGYTKSDGEGTNETSEGGKKGIQKDHQTSTSEQDNFNINRGTSSNEGFNAGRSDSITIEIANKRCMELMKYMDEELLDRLKSGFTNGLFKTSIYYMADNPADANRLRSCLVSLLHGDKGSYCPLIYKELKPDDAIKKILFAYQNQSLNKDSLNADSRMLLSRPANGLNTYLTPQEISIVAGLPQKEVPGLALVEGVDFGLNLSSTAQTASKEKKISLGKVIQKDREVDGLFFEIDKETLKKHVFIAGTTGSGKTTTCLKLLSEAKMPFLVIEPAKTEYRILLKQEANSDVIVFTLGDDRTAPFRLNPFELFPGENISGHVDMLKASFTSAFPMEASMPQILEEAIYNCYRKKGWNIITNTNKNSGKDITYPTISDLLDELRNVVKEKGFGNELRANYEGSLVSRLSNLTVGSKGSMLDCTHSIDFDFLLTHKVILEMEEIRSPEDKALLMGFILSRLSASIKKKHESNPDFQHITLVEEAHRLLAKTDYSDGGARKNAVASFADMLAEVRKYGEGLIIVDQIPEKLAPEVLKNTNTKIIHKLFARDDKEAVGDTMLMDDKQKNYLSSLETGHAIVFSEHTPKPIHIAVERTADTSSLTPDNRFVSETFDKVRKSSSLGTAYSELEMQTLSHFDEFRDRLDAFLKDFDNKSLENDIRKNMAEAINSVLGNNEIDPNDLWENLFRMYYRKNGRSNSTSSDKLNKKIDRMMQIFFKGDEITEQDKMSLFR